MATDVEKLVVQLSADIKQYQREMNRAQGVTNAQARAIESRYRQMDKRLGEIGQNAASSLIEPLAGVAAALSVQEVLKYADAWTSVKNSLAVAGVVGSLQADVLNDLYASAQRNAAPIGALADLYGNASQSQAELGASSKDLTRFADGVAVALRVSGKSATESAGALGQLGQLLGSTHVQAEEFNSIIDGARPILIAVANGMDKAGGSVSKLKQLVNDGVVTNKEFFESFLRGLPTIQSMAANATQTIEQGVTKVNNAFTKYIGSQDQSLGATQMLSRGLNALVDDFDNLADNALVLATIISGALVGRAIGGMIVKAGLGVKAITELVTALKAARAAGSVSLALSGIGAAAGPLGVIVGVAAAGAMMHFGAEALEASARSAMLKDEMKALGDTSEGARSKIDAVGVALNKLAPDELQKRLSDIKKEIDRMNGRSVMNIIGVGDADTLGDVRATLKSMNGRSDNRAAVRQIQAILQEYDDGKVTLDEFKARLEAIAQSSPGDAIVGLITKLKEAIPYMKFLGTEARRTAAEIQKVPASADVPGFASEGARGAGDQQRAREVAETQRKLDERLSESQRSELERQVDQRAKQIVKEFGDKITEAAARIQAVKEINAENMARSSDRSASSAFDLIKGYEGFSAKPYWDVNALRAGYGSDTVTLDDGSVRKVTDGITVTLAGATRDLERRIGDFQKGIEGQIGADTFRSMDDSQQAALTSIAYNYGSLPERIVAAIKSGDAGTVYSAIKGLGGDNGGINRGRRDSEADLYLKGAPAGVQTRVEAQSNFAQTLKDQQAYVEALKAETGIRASLSPLVDDYGQKLSTFQAAQQLFTDAQREGIAAGKELVSVQQLLNGDLSALSPVAREQALAMRALAEETGKAEAAGQQLQVTQAGMQEKLQGISDFSKDLLGGFIQDLRDGKSAGEAFAGVLQKIGDRLLNNVLDSLFQVNAASGGGGGFFGSLITSLFGGGTGAGAAAPVKAAGGGRVSGPGTSTSDSIPAMLSDGEHVVNAKAAKQNRALLEAINSGKTLRLAGGGAVGAAMSMPRIQSSGSGGGMSRIKVDVGVGVDEDGNLQGYVKRISERSADEVSTRNVRHFSEKVLPGRVKQIDKSPRKVG